MGVGEGSATSDEHAMKASLHIGGPGDLNVHAKDGGGFLGWATLPFSGFGGNCDGVVIADETVHGGTFAPFNEGDTLTHKVDGFPHSPHSNLFWMSVLESHDSLHCFATPRRTLAWFAAHI